MIKILDKNLWKIIVENMPIPAKDLLFYSKNKGLLMGKRMNKPAKNYYFVPGGRVFKNESRNDAIKRISIQEVDLSIDPEECFSIGVYDHYYDDSIWENTKITTHYIIEAILIPIKDNQKIFNVDSQHSEFIWINQTNVDNLNVHKYSKKYLTDILNMKKI